MTLVMTESSMMPPLSFVNKLKLPLPGLIALISLTTSFSKKAMASLPLTENKLKIQPESLRMTDSE